MRPIDDSSLGFLLNKKPGVRQPQRIEKAKILIANTPMDTDKIKVFGSRVKVDSIAKVAELEVAEKEKMKEKVSVMPTTSKALLTRPPYVAIISVFASQMALLGIYFSSLFTSPRISHLVIKEYSHTIRERERGSTHQFARAWT